MKSWRGAKWEDALIGLGSNLGDRLGNLAPAVRLIGRIPGVRVGRVSRVWRTAPVGYRGQRWFYNAAMSIHTVLSATALVRGLKSAERALGRRERFRNGPREIDLDLLLLGDKKVRGSSAVVPHPRMHSRRFVLAPCAEIAPAMRHPIARVSISRLLDGLKAGGSVRPLARAGQRRFRTLIAGRKA